MNEFVNITLTDNIRLYDILNAVNSFKQLYSPITAEIIKNKQTNEHINKHANKIIIYKIMSPTYCIPDWQRQFFWMHHDVFARDVFAHTS